VSYNKIVLQDHWARADGAQATREDLMMALSQLDYILIKAEYAEETRESRLHVFEICDKIFSYCTYMMNSTEYFNSIQR